MSCGNKCNCATYKEHLQGINFSAHAMPNRKSSLRTVQVDAADKQMEKDHAAYKALRRQGYQPKDTDGAAELQARMSDPIEIQTNTILGEKRVKRVKSDIERVKELSS